MRVYTYYEPIPGFSGATPLIDLWAETWQNNGWRPVVLCQKDAEEHSSFRHYKAAVDKLPSVNKREYERACYLRHMAMLTIGGGLLTDYDVMNRSFNPSHYECLCDGKLTILEPTRVPCVISGNAEAFQGLCDHIAGYRPGPSERHVSDMTILRKTKTRRTSHCIEHLCSGLPIENDLGDGWKTASLIHFSTYSFQKLSKNTAGRKDQLVKEVLDQLGRQEEHADLNRT